MDIVYILIGIVIGGIAGFFLARFYMKKYLKKNPPINEQMIKAMMMQMGMNSIFFGQSNSQRPIYNYDYDYLEEFYRSSSSTLKNKKRNYAIA